MAGVPKKADRVDGRVTRNALSAAQNTDAGEDPFSKSELGVGQKDGLEGTASGWKGKWDCTQAEDDFDEGDVMYWLEDDEMMRQWEDVSKEEENITVRKMEGRSLQVEGVQKVPELLMSQVLSKEKGPKKEKKKK